MNGSGWMVGTREGEKGTLRRFAVFQAQCLALCVSKLRYPILTLEYQEADSILQGLTGRLQELKSLASFKVRWLGSGRAGFGASGRAGFGARAVCPPLLAFLAHHTAVPVPVLAFLFVG